MYKFQIIILFLSCVLFLNCSGPQNANPHDEEWIQLFNGQDIDKWSVKFNGYELGVNHKNTFKVEDSLLKVRYHEYDSFVNGEFGHLFYNQEFSYYRLKATYRFVEDQVPGGPGWAFRNNGFMLHSQSPESMGLNQDFPISLEMQLLGGNGDTSRPTANLCTPGTNVHFADTLFTPHCISSTSETFHGDQWVEVEVLVLGDSILQHIVGGQPVLTYTKPVIGGGNVSGLIPEKASLSGPLGKGYIAIQAETHPIDFKKIEVLNLCGCTDEKAKNHKSYYVKSDNTQCIY